MKAFIKSSFILAACFALAGGCYYDKEETLYGAIVNCAGTSYTYTTDVNAIIVAYCATSGCHDSSNAGNVTLVTYGQAVEQAARINQRVVIEKTMPPSTRLSADQIAVIKCWIANGTIQ